MHGHRPVVEVERTGNRWNIDTGAGIAQLNRLSILELGAELRPWTFDVDGPRTRRMAKWRKSSATGPSLRDHHGNVEVRPASRAESC